MPDLSRPDTTSTMRNDAPDPPARTVPGIPPAHAADAIGILQGRLTSLLDLGLTLRHIHANVHGPDIAGAQATLADHTTAAQFMGDELAERISVLGGSPSCTPGSIVAVRNWDDYSLGRAPVLEHFSALCRVYDGVVLDHRRACVSLDNADPVSAGVILGQLAELEAIQATIRSWVTDPRTETTARSEPASGTAQPPYQQKAGVGARHDGEGTIT